MRTRIYPLGLCGGFILREDEVILNIEHPLPCLMGSLTSNFLSVTRLDFNAELSEIYARLWHLITTRISEIASLHVSHWIVYFWQWIWSNFNNANFFFFKTAVAEKAQTFCALYIAKTVDMIILTAGKVIPNTNFIAFHRLIPHSNLCWGLHNKGYKLACYLPLSICIL